jgi:hypothetical protein
VFYLKLIASLDFIVLAVMFTFLIGIVAVELSQFGTICDHITIRVDFDDNYLFSIP